MSRKSSINKIKRSNTASKNIEASLIMHLYEKQHSPITSHFIGYGLGECDVISISKSDFIYEYEVKISRSDFFADFKKEKHRLMTERSGVKETLILEYGETIKDVWYSIPNHFYFVVPQNLVKIEEIPEYAGLIYMTESGDFEIIKKAPILHKVRATHNFIRQLGHNLTCKLVFRKVD